MYQSIKRGVKTRDLVLNVRGELLDGYLTCLPLYLCVRTVQYLGCEFRLFTLVL